MIEAGRGRHTPAEAARLAELSAETLREYCQAGLLGAPRAAEEPFDDDAIYELRRIEFYRRRHGVNREALPIVLDLLREVERLRAELRARR